MPQITGTDAKTGCFDITYGRDPRLYLPRTSCRLAIDETHIQFSYRQPLIKIGLAGIAHPYLERVTGLSYFFTMLLLLFISPVLVQHIWFFGLLFLFFFVVALIKRVHVKRQSRFQRESLTNLQQQDREISFMAKQEKDAMPEFSLFHVKNRHDMEMILRTLADPCATLHSPMAVHYGADPLCDESGFYNERQGTITFNGEAIHISGVKRSRRVIRNTYLPIVYLFVGIGIAVNRRAILTHLRG